MLPAISPKPLSNWQKTTLNLKMTIWGKSVASDAFKDCGTRLLPYSSTNGELTRPYGKSRR